MKRIKLRRWVKMTIVIIFLISAIMVLKILDNHFMKNCMESGYNKNYCKGER